MKVCLIGAGRIGQLHARTLAADPHTSELVVADADAERARVLADEVGARHAAVDEALGTADALVIAAATDAHAQLVRRGLERRVPTFCEKPLARELDETLELVSLVEDSGVPLQVGFQRRFDAGYAEARRLVASGELGVLYCVRLASHDPEPPHEAYIPTSGGLFRDLSIHDFDIIRWLTGAEVEEVYADGAVRNFEVFARYDDIDTAVATLRMSDGSLAVLTAARHDPPGATFVPSSSAHVTASAWVSVPGHRCDPWTPVSIFPRGLPGPISWSASRTPIARSSARSCAWPRVSCPARAQPATGSRPCGPPSPRRARSGTTGLSRWRR